MTEQNLDANNEQVTSGEAVQEAVKPEEKLLKQSEVDKIVYAKKMEGIEKGKALRDAEIAAQTVAIQQQSAPPNQPPPPSQMDQNVQMTPEQRQFVSEEVERQAQIKIAQQDVNSFASKLISGKEKYQDFDETVCKLDLANMPIQIVNWANNLDNTADVMYEIAKNPTKYSDVLTLSVRAPALAQDLLGRVSESIKQNEAAAKNQAQAPEPLDQTKPSTTGTDNGKMSISDLRKQDWLRG